MIILHTSDWHLNSTLGSRKRNGDLCRSLQQIKNYVEQYHVDVMVISGDLFRERSRPEQIQAGIEIIKTYFQPFLQRGGTMLAISGNHDSDILFTTLRDAQDLVAFGPQEQEGIQTTGRFYFAPHPGKLRLRDGQGNVVQFVLMPYPTPRYLRGDKVFYRTLEERNIALKDAFETILRVQLNGLDPREPAVLVSHIAVRGSTSTSNYRLDDANEIIVEQSALPSSLTYIALGHIHRPQEVLLGAAHMRYAGSIERMDYGERDDQKSVVLLEIQGRRLCGPPQLLPLRCTSFYEVEIIDPDTQLPLLAQKYPDAQEALVRYVLHWDSLTHQRDRLCQQIEAIFPRWYDRTLKDKQTGIITEAGLEVQLTHDVVGTTRHYLHSQLEQHPLRQDLFALVEQLFVEEEEA